MAFEKEIFAHLRELTDLVFFNICLRALLVLYPTFQMHAYALRLPCSQLFRCLPTHCVCLASIKALLKALILLRLWRKA